MLPAWLSAMQRCIQSGSAGELEPPARTGRSVVALQSGLPSVTVFTNLSIASRLMASLFQKRASVCEFDFTLWRGVAIRPVVVVVRKTDNFVVWNLKQMEFAQNGIWPAMRYWLSNPSICTSLIVAKRRILVRLCHRPAFKQVNNADDAARVKQAIYLVYWIVPKHILRRATGTDQQRPPMRCRPATNLNRFCAVYERIGPRLFYR